MKVRQLQQRDWDQLLMVATGYLPMTDGDLRKAMALAIAAHADLIAGVRTEGITAQLAKGSVTLFVPEEGGLALAFERKADEDEIGLPEVTLEVVDRSGTYSQVPNHDSGVVDDDSWSDVG